MNNPYASGVLKEEHHSRLVADLDRFAHDAGISPIWLATSMVGVCGNEEIAFTKSFRKRKANGGKVGLCYTGTQGEPSVEDRMAAMTGCFLRNFIRARLMTLGRVVEHIKDGAMPEASVLLIPNFFLTKAEGGAISDWRVAELLDLLMQRQLDGQDTVIYLSSFKSLGTEYGSQFVTFIGNHYQEICL